MVQTDGNKKFWQQVGDFIEAAVLAGRDYNDIVGKIDIASRFTNRDMIHPKDSSLLPLGTEHDKRWKKMQQFLQDYRVREDWGWDMVLCNLRIIAMGVRDLDQIGPLPLLPLYD